MAEQLGNLLKKINEKKLVSSGSSAVINCEIGDIVVVSRIKGDTQGEAIYGGNVLLNQQSTAGYVVGSGVQTHLFLTIVEATSTTVSMITVQSNFNSYAIYR